MNWSNMKKLKFSAKKKLSVASENEGIQSFLDTTYLMNVNNLSIT